LLGQLGQEWSYRLSVDLFVVWLLFVGIGDLVSLSDGRVIMLLSSNIVRTYIEWNGGASTNHLRLYKSQIIQPSEGTLALLAIPRPPYLPSPSEGSPTYLILSSNQQQHSHRSPQQRSITTRKRKPTRVNEQTPRSNPLTE